MKQQSNNGLNEENSLRKGKKRSIRWEGDGVSFVGRKRNDSH